MPSKTIKKNKLDIIINRGDNLVFDEYDQIVIGYSSFTKQDFELDDGYLKDLLKGYMMFNGIDFLTVSLHERKMGRPKIDKPDNWDNVISIWKNGRITAINAARELNLNTRTFYRMLKENGISKMKVVS